jgi:hypothetical protein
MSLARIRSVSGRLVSRVWCFSGFRNRMIFFRSIAKPVAFAKAPPVPTHEGCDRVRLRQSGKRKNPKFGRRRQAGLLHCGLNQSGRRSKTDVGRSIPFQEPGLFGALGRDLTLAA